MLSDIIKLMIGFGKAGLFGYGGGVGLIGILRSTVVGGHGWLTEQEFADAVTISYSLPGPVATQLAGVIGWKVAGVVGAVASIIAVVLPSLVAMFAMVYFVHANEQNTIIKGVMNGIRPVVFAILGILALEFGGFVSANWITAGIAAVTFILLYYFKINPAFAVLGAALIGGLFLRE